MIKIGDFNKLEVKRSTDFGYFLDGKTNNSKDDILLHKRLIGKNEVNVGDTVNAFIYIDSEGRKAATLIPPKAKVNEVAYLKVVAHTKIGSFIDIGLQKDILVPFKAKTYDLEKGHRYLFYIYLDKTGRLAATTEVEPYIDVAEEGTFKVGDEVTAMVFSKTPSGTLNVAIDAKYRGLVLPNEYYDEVHPGYEMKLRVKRLYEDGVIGLTPRKTRLSERDELQEKIVAYMRKNGGFMEFNDKSNPEDIRATFGTSKNYFKMALGGLMKAGKLTQDKEGSKLI